MTEQAELTLRKGLILHGDYSPASSAGNHAPGEPAYVDESTLTLSDEHGGPPSVAVVLAWVTSGVFPPTAFDLAGHLQEAHEHPTGFREPVTT